MPLSRHSRFYSLAWVERNPLHFDDRSLRERKPQFGCRRIRPLDMIPQYVFSQKRRERLE